MSLFGNISQEIDIIRKEVERITLEREAILRELGVSIDNKEELEKMITQEINEKINAMAIEKVNQMVKEAEKTWMKSLYS